jgi:tetratricopeptide (TPR) repeat protein
MMGKRLILIVLAVGVLLLSNGFLLAKEESAVRHEYDRYNEACQLVEQGNLEAVAVFFEVAIQTEDPFLRSRAFYNLANIGWAQASSADSIIEFYQNALRAQPGYREAAFNLELLYDLLQQAKQQEQVPGEGEGGNDEGAGTTGDI